MDEKDAINEINELLDKTDYPVTITDIVEVEEFLLDDSNRRFMEEYATIGRIYDDLRGWDQIDRYPEPSVIKEGEEQKEY